MPIQRSANAFATGVRTGVLRTLQPFGSEDLVEGVDELASAVAHECPGAGELVAVTEQQAPGGLGGPDAAGVVRDPCEVHAPGRDVDEEQQVEPAHRDGFDGGEVAGDGGLGPQELRPSDFAASGGGVDSGVLEDLPDRGRSEAVAEPGELAMDAAISPSRILGCEAQCESAKLRCRRWPARRSLWLGPVSGDAAPVPAQKCVGGDQPPGSARSRERGRNRPKQAAVGVGDLGSVDLAAQHSELVAQHDDLEVLRAA